MSDKVDLKSFHSWLSREEVWAVGDWPHDSIACLPPAGRKSEQMNELLYRPDPEGDLSAPEREQQKSTNRKALLLVYLCR
jgi:hypothetical protein